MPQACSLGTTEYWEDGAVCKVILAVETAVETTLALRYNDFKIRYILKDYSSLQLGEGFTFAFRIAFRISPK
jgi:hypothetical protein